MNIIAILRIIKTVRSGQLRHAVLLLIVNLSVALVATVSAQTVSRRPAFEPPLADWLGTVIYVVDGDTLYVRPAGGGKPVSVRIDGIDAPEICQAGGVLAQQVLRQRVLGQQVQIQAKALDRYGRLVASVIKGGIDQGAELVETGQAWAFRFEVGRGPYAALQRRAELEGLGLFSAGPHPQTPAAFRKTHGSCH